MITVRATMLESFRLYKDPDLDFISADEIEARLRGAETIDAEARARMAKGTAFHAAVERCPLDFEPVDREVVQEGDFTFAARAVRDARHGLEGIPECYGETVIHVGSTPVLLTGHTDWLHGIQAWDLKTSGKAIPADRHASSMQWRVYCLVFGVQRVTYRHVYLADDKQGVTYARAIDDVTVYAYPQLRGDVVACVRDLLAFSEIRGCLDAMGAPSNDKDAA